MEKNRKQLLEAASTQAKLLQGHVGADGKEILPSATPKVNGYGFVVTPSPAPGKVIFPLSIYPRLNKLLVSEMQGTSVV